MMRFIQKLGRFALYGGFGGPRPYETEILNVTVAALPEADARTLGKQIGSIERLQRWNGDRMVIVGFADKDALSKLQVRATDHCLAKLRLTGPLGSITARVMTHRGILSSLEFSRSPRKLADEGFSVQLVEMHADDPGMSRVIDEEEHERR